MPATAAETVADLPVRDYNRAVRRVALFLLAGGVFARVVRLFANGPFWLDEAAVALNVADRPFAGLAVALDHFQVAPVLFLWSERALYLLFGGGEWVLRIIPLLLGLGALGLFWDFARRTVHPTAAVLAVGLLAVGRWPISQATFAKPYAGDLFWAAALLAFAARWHQRPERLRPLVLLAVLVPVAVGSSFPVVFVGGAVSLYLLPTVWRHPRRAARVWFAAFNLLMVVTFVVCVRLSSRGADAATVGDFMANYWSEAFPPADLTRFPLWLLERHAGRMSAYPIGDGNGGSSWTVAVFTFGAVIVWRSGNRPLAVLCLVPFALNLVAAALHKYPYGACCRLSQHLAPAICLLAGVGWARVHEWIAPRRAARLVWVKVSAGLLGAFLVGVVLSDVATPEVTAVSRWSRDLGRELRRDWRPGDRLMIAPDPDADLSTFWYLRPFVAPPGSSGEQVPGRLWVVFLTRSAPDAAAENAFKDGVRPAGWVVAADVKYTLRPYKPGVDWHFARVVCLRRADDTSAPPVLAASPGG